MIVRRPVIITCSYAVSMRIPGDADATANQTVKCPTKTY